MTMPHPALLWLKSDSGWKPALADTDGHFQVDVLSCANPSNLDRKITDAIADLRGASSKTLTDLDTKIGTLDSDLRGSSSKDFTTLETDVESMHTDQLLHAARNVTWLRLHVSNNNTTSIIRTVTAGKTLYIAHAHCMLNNVPAGACAYWVGVRDGGDTYIADICGGYLASAAGIGGGRSVSPATVLAVPAGYDVVLVSVSCEARSSIWGWEE